MNPPSFDPEDDQLTAYALGELPEGPDRAAVEQLLASSPDARAEVEQIRSVVSLLVAEYEGERQDAVGRDTGLATAAGSNLVEFPAQHKAPISGRAYRWLGLAAVFVVLAGLVWMLAANARREPAPRHVIAANSGFKKIAPTAPVPAASPLPAVLLALNKEVMSLGISLDSSKARDTKRDQVNESYAKKETDAPAEPALPSVGKDAGEAPGLAAQDQQLAMLKAVPNQAAGPVEPQSFLGAAQTKSPPLIAPAPQPGAKGGPLFVDGIVGGNPSRPTSRAGAVPPVASSGSVQREIFRRSVERRPGGSTDTSIVASAKPMAAPLSRPAYEAEDVFRTRAVDRITPAREDTAAYDHLAENAFLTARDNPLSTFSTDVDTASYANVRRFIESGTMPPRDAVRVEELINYFPYDDAPPAADNPHPFALHLEAAACPWEPAHRLVRIGIKGREMARDRRPASNLVFLIDVSGSMMPPERLPLIKEGLRLLVEKLTEDDHVSIVVYAGNTGLALPSTSGDHKDKILHVLDHLEAGGSTNGAGGIQLAYQVAQENFIKGGVNRVILATDGDFNVGVTNQNELVRLIEKEAKGGVFLSALGVGTDNFKDSTMQKLADRGNGNYAYIDRLEEARKVLVEQMSGTLVTIAKDVKIQVEFNPAAVASYRLIGYEKRLLRKEDFNDDKVDAGEIGAGHSVTALYEVVPVAGRGGSNPAAGVDSLKYQSPASTPAPAPAPVETPAAGSSPELLTLKMRYKAPDADKSERAYEQPLVDHPEAGNDLARASADFKFAAAVTEFGLVLRDSPYKGNSTLEAVIELAHDGRGPDASGYRTQFIDLVRRAQTLESSGR